MTLLYYDPVFMEHRTGDHPESPGRILPLTKHLHFVGLDAECERPSWEAASDEQIMFVHGREYLQRLEQLCLEGGGWLDDDTVVSTKSLVAARRASGAICDAVRRIIAGEDKNAFCLSRPPGHHALKGKAMGFCLLNHVAVAAAMARHQHGCDRVLIVDFDVHHGNGTQDLFYDDPAIAYFSIHRHPFYPHTGHAEETGEGRGRGSTCNVPLGREVARENQFRRFENELTDFAQAIKPDLILVSAGFDAHQDDPIGSLGWQTSDYARVGELMLSLADEHCQGRVVSVLEGGYNPEALCDSATLYLECLSRQGK